MTDDTILAFFFRHERAARIYDGADEVHRMNVAKRILKEYELKIRGWYQLMTYNEFKKLVNLSKEEISGQILSATATLSRLRGEEGNRQPDTDHRCHACYLQ